MHHVALDKQDEVIKQFVLSLPVGPQGTMLELDGSPVAFIVSPADGNGADEPWTKEKNDRRCELIERKYTGGITPAEMVELARLQEQMQRWRQRVAPLPLEHARQLHQDLLEKATAQADT